MGLLESGEMYLETIYVLSKKGGSVRSVDVGEYMGYSKPSVSRAVSILKKNGYVVMNEDSSLALTKEGRALAEKIYERHDLITQFLIKLGVDEKIAAEDACKMEHDISDTTLEAIRKSLENK